MNFSLQRHNPPGFTLVEIMVSMVIALIVMGGVYQTLVDESVEHDRSEKILDMQNNARVVLGRLTRDVRNAGFLSCGGDQLVNTLPNAGTGATMIGELTVARVPVLVSDPPGKLRHMDPNDNPYYSTILQELNATGVGVDYLGEALGFNNDAPADHAHYQVGTDAITLVYLTDERAVVPPPAAGVPTDPLTLTAVGFSQNDILYLTDCDDFTLFQQTADTDGDRTTVEHLVAGVSSDLGKKYGEAALARAFRLTTKTYFIRKDRYTLNLNSYEFPIASGIEDLQFEFLFDEDGDKNLAEETWVSNFGAHTSKEVRAVRIWLLAMSDTDYAYTDTNTYDYPNSPYYSAANPFASANGAGGSPAALAPAGPANGEHRHRFLASTVVYLRNAGLVLE
jgi:prepilin-type N-terminal cleavage/methylation domain-containing protein